MTWRILGGANSIKLTLFGQMLILIRSIYDQLTIEHRVMSSCQNGKTSRLKQLLSFAHGGWLHFLQVFNRLDLS